MISQSLALKCLEYNTFNSNDSGNNNNNSNSKSLNWSQNKIASLKMVRDAVWKVVEPLGTVYTKGAFYFLVPVPLHVSTLTLLVYEYDINCFHL